MDSQTQAPALQADRSAYLAAMRHVPGAVAIIAGEADGVKGGLAATAWTSVCADPPMMLVCVNQSASAHAILAQNTGFTINFLAANDEETAAIFSAQRGLSGHDRFLDHAWKTGQSGQPVLAAAQAAFECRLVERHVYGTHSVLIGQVEAVHNASDGAGLLYVAGAYAKAEKLES
jgi:flavin reductase (DIM6/NTAB) family NADH-FMN oxidoreductase RutF